MARLPTALCGTALVLLIFLLGRRLIGPRRAFLGALVAATSVLLLRFARLCETDVPLALCTSAAALAGYFGMTARRPWRWWLSAGVCAGLGFLIKGPAAVVMPLAAWLAFAAVSRRARRLVHLPRAAACLAVWALIALPWYVSLFFLARAPAGTDIGYELNALVSRSAHTGPFPYFYLHTLPTGLGAWGPLLPLAVVVAWRRARAHLAVRFLLAWLLSSLIILSASESKQLHYTALLLVPSALLLGLCMHHGLRRLRGWKPWSCAPGARWSACSWPPPAPPWSGCRSGPARSRTRPASRWASDGARRRRAPVLAARRRFAALVLGATLGLMVLNGAYAARIHDLLEPAGLYRSFAAEAARLRPGAAVFLAGRRLNALQYCLDARITRVQSLNEGLRRARPGDLIILSANPSNPVIPDRVPIAPLSVRSQGEITLMLFRK